MHDDIGVPIKLSFQQKLKSFAWLIILLIFLALFLNNIWNKSKEYDINPASLNVRTNITGKVINVTERRNFTDLTILNDNNREIHIYVYSPLDSEIIDLSEGDLIETSAFKLKRKKVTAYKAKKISYEKTKPKCDD